MRNEYVPDYVSPPGDTILEILYDRKITVNELSKVLGINNIGRLLNGLVPITEEIAVKLEELLNVDRQFWINRERLYRKRERK